MLSLEMDLDQNIKNQSNIVNKRPFIEWSFVFYINNSKVQNYLPAINPVFISVLAT